MPGHSALRARCLWNTNFKPKFHRIIRFLDNHDSPIFGQTTFRYKDEISRIDG